jgi:hypothetical protein
MTATPEDLRALIDQMREDAVTSDLDELSQVIASEKLDKEGLVETNSGTELLGAELARIKAQISALKQVETAMSDALKAIIADGKGVQHNGTPIARKNVTYPRRLNTKLVQELFPYETHPTLYIETEQETLLLDPAFKKAAIQGEITA